MANNTVKFIDLNECKKALIGWFPSAVQLEELSPRYTRTVMIFL